jgi:hypothetical protein
VRYENACTRDEDCAWVRQPTCCGPIHALGVRKGEEARVTSTCTDCPPLACALGPLVADDGKASKGIDQAKDVAVSCVKAVCTSRITN